jgi:hypothetical protein
LKKKLNLCKNIFLCKQKKYKRKERQFFSTKEQFFSCVEIFFIEKYQQNETNRISDCTFWNRYVFSIFVGLQNVFKVQKET